MSILLHEVRSACASGEEQNRSFPAGLDCLKMYVPVYILQMLCLCHDKLWTAEQLVVSFSWGNGGQLQCGMSWGCDPPSPGGLACW